MAREKRGSLVRGRRCKKQSATLFERWLHLDELKVRLKQRHDPSVNHASAGDSGPENANKT